MQNRAHPLLCLITCSWRRAIQHPLENVTGFLLHGASMLRRANPQSALQVIVEVAHRYACHRLIPNAVVREVYNDCIAVTIDGDASRRIRDSVAVGRSA